MFGLQVGKDERVEIYHFVSVLERALACHLNDRVCAAAVGCAAQEALQKEAPRHGHLKKIALAFAGDTKADSARRGNRAARAVQKSGYHLDRAGPALGAGDVDDANPSGGGGGRKS